MNNRNKEIIKRSISIISILTFLLVMTMYYYVPKKDQLLSSMAFLQNSYKLSIQDVTTGILLKDATPVLDEVGMNNDPYTFKVINKSNKAVTYKIVFNNNKEKVTQKGKEVLDNKYLRYTIQEENNDYQNPSNLTEDGLIYTATINPRSEVVFNFKMWLDYDADNGAMNKVFIGTIALEEIK